MKVKIIKSTGADYWYKDFIGKIFEVKEWKTSGADQWRVEADDTYHNHYIDRDDAVIFKDPIRKVLGIRKL